MFFLTAALNERIEIKTATKVTNETSTNVGATCCYEYYCYYPANIKV